MRNWIFILCVTQSFTLSAEQTKSNVGDFLVTTSDFFMSFFPVTTDLESSTYNQVLSSNNRLIDAYHPYSENFHLSYDSSIQQAEAITVSYWHQKLLPWLADDYDENNALLHYLHVGQDHRLMDKTPFWLYSGVGFSYFDTTSNYSSDNVKISFSLGLHSSLWSTPTMKLQFQTQFYATYLANQQGNICYEVHCFSAPNSNFWLQKQAKLNFSLNF